MIVAGADLSTRALDLCVLDTETMAAEHRRVTLASKGGQWWQTAGRMWQLLDWADMGDPDGISPLDWLRYRRVTLLGIERPYGPSRQSIASLHVILGALLATLAIDAQWLPTLEIRPSEMRHCLGLKANASKQEMHAEIVARLVAGDGMDTTAAIYTPDALDSWAVAWAAYKICERAAEQGAA